MIFIKPTLYERLRLALVEMADGAEYLSTTIWLEDDDTEYQFIATLLVEYHEVLYPEGASHEPLRITPVWWELHTYNNDGEEEINNFDLAILINLICP